MPPPKAKQRRAVGTARRVKASKENPRDFGFFEGPVQARWLPPITTTNDVARVARLVQQRPDISLEEIESLNQQSLRAKVPKKPDAMRGASSLSDSKAIAPVAHDGPCLAPNPR
jgi:hypothetical protein